MARTIAHRPQCYPYGWELEFVPFEDGGVTALFRLRINS